MYDVTKTRIYGVLTLTSLAVTAIAGIWTARGIVQPDSEQDTSVFQEQEVSLLSSVQFAMQILPYCDFPDERRENIETQLNRAFNLLKLRHSLAYIEANNIYNNMYGNYSNQLLSCNSTEMIRTVSSPTNTTVANIPLSNQSETFFEEAVRTANVTGTTGTITNETQVITNEPLVPNQSIVQEPPTQPLLEQPTGTDVLYTFGAAVSIILAGVTAVLAITWKSSRKKVSI